MSEGRQYCYPRAMPVVEQKFFYRETVPYFIHTMALMNRKSGSFTTSLPGGGGKVRAKREIIVEVTGRKTGFIPLNEESLKDVIKGDGTGTIDFKIKLQYTYLDEKYRPTPFKGDTYLVRANFEGTEQERKMLTLKVHHIDGPRKTRCEEVVDTIITELEKNHQKTR